MNYLQAIKVARQSIDNLDKDDGSMTEYELIVTLAGLDLAVKEIAKRIRITLPK